MNKNTTNTQAFSLPSSVWRVVAFLVLFVFISDTFILPNLNYDQNTVLMELNAEENDSEEEKEESEETEKNRETKIFHVGQSSIPPILISNIYLKIWNNFSLLSHSWDLITPPPELG